MKASELVKQLQDFIGKFGDLDVMLFTDHGQAQSTVYDVSVKDHETGDLEDEGGSDTKVFELYGE
tara:strand:- start:311 stop:505 length:195 start_codon:yes stop_codon:yes gene_type:complete